MLILSFDVGLCPFRGGAADGRLAITSRKLICLLNLKLRLNECRRVQDCAMSALMLPSLYLIKKIIIVKYKPVIADTLIGASGARIH